jgi:UDP-N-acetylglucosamine acyltransferase
MSHAQINGVRQAFRLLVREGLPLPAAVARMERDLGHIDVVQEMITFLRKCGKGINPLRLRPRDDAAA